jgi:hypothetical protein
LRCADPGNPSLPGDALSEWLGDVGARILRLID